MNTLLSIITALLFGNKTNNVAEQPPTMLHINGKLVKVYAIDNYYYTKDVYGATSPLLDENGRHVRKGML